MLITKEMEVKWNSKTKEHYESKGYKFTKIGETFICKVEDLTDGSHKKVEFICDYCKDEGIKDNILSTTWQSYLSRKNNSVIKKDCCKKHWYRKCKESNLINYGVENQFEREEVKDKIIETCLDKYGVPYCQQNETVHNKTLQTNIEKYGVDNPSKNKDVIDLIHKVKLEKYGENYQQEAIDKMNSVIKEKFNVDNYFQTEEFKEKSKKTCMDKYGVPYSQQSKEIHSKTMHTLSYNNKVNTSIQQKYLHQLFGGELNYNDETTGVYSLDIAFPEQKEAIEYNGGGHNLGVKLGCITQKQFDKRELDRYFYLKRNGWKMIKIESPCDYLPNDEILLNEIGKAREWLRDNDYGHSHYNIIIGEHINDDKYGHLRKIKKQDIINL